MQKDDDDRFHHHPFLETVAAQDVAYLKEKDRSYGASWKLAGGRSAWFMLRRKMDRMIEMMKRPEPPYGWSESSNDTVVQKNGDIAMAADIARYLLASHQAEDIFGMVEKDPSGRDGCVLAEVRDLRRYLLLVEAEMVARGVVEQRTGQEHPFGYHPSDPI